MDYDNVTLWFAKNENEEIITIDDINDSNKKNTYSCPMCGSNLKPKAIKSKKIASHFAHVDASKCSNETMIHWWFKNKFLEKGDSFVVVSNKERQYMCKDVLIEQSYRLSDGKFYKPDVTVITECDKVIYFEMDYSNKKVIKDYIDIWLELRNIVVEVDIKKLMVRKVLPTFKSLFYDGKCFNVKKNDAYYNYIGEYKEKILRDGLNEELKERIKKLDWFWCDIFRYKKSEINIEYMANLIDSIEGKDREVIEVILDRKSCITLSNDLYKYNQIKYAEEEIKYKKNLDHATNNEFIKFVVCKLNKMYKEVDEKYQFLTYNAYGRYRTVYLSFNGREKIDVTLTEEIIYSNNIVLIEDFFVNSINKYMDTVTPFKNYDFITNTIDTIKKTYENIIFNRKKVAMEKKINRKWVDYFENIDTKYFIVQKDIALDCIIIELIKNDDQNRKIFEFCIYKNSVYIVNNIHCSKWDTKLDNSTIIKTFNTNVDWIALEKILRNSINSQIQNDMNNTCCNCNEKFILENNEFNFFINKELTFPKRCKKCRDIRKQENKLNKEELNIG